MKRRHWGVDVGTRALHAVAIDDDGRLAGAVVVAPARVAELVERVAGAPAVGVDAPDRWSLAHHAGDDRLPGKFRTARCGEIQLRHEFGYPVPWTTPVATGARTGWMEVGFEVHAALRPVAGEVVEVFPHAAFLHLAGRRTLPAKASPAGARVRADLLAARLDVDAGELLLWSADALDALAAALTARDVAAGRSDVARCPDHPDDSAIHLPAPS
ncbi:MAG: DUF429 domain-containing protein [Actinobacteria bacterium]|nr:DUF429 domain-containing protein [Actinomycetota bacterium]